MKIFAIGKRAGVADGRGGMAGMPSDMAWISASSAGGQCSRA